MKNWLLNKKNQFYVALIVSAVVFVTQWWVMKDVTTNGVWEWFISSFLLFFLLPVLVIKIFFKEKLKNFHLSFDLNWQDVVFSLIVGLILVGLIVFLLIKLEWYKKFPVSDLFLGSRNVVYLVEFILFPLVVFFREFFFRGFLFRATERAIGYGWAILIQLVGIMLIESSVVPFLGFQVYLLFIVINLFLGIIVLRTRSIFITMVISWLIGVVIDFSVLYNIGSVLFS